MDTTIGKVLCARITALMTGSQKTVVHLIEVADISSIGALEAIDADKLLGLGRQLLRTGVWPPLTVCAVGQSGNKFRLIYGEKRLAACRAVGISRVPCVILGEMRTETPLPPPFTAFSPAEQRFLLAVGASEESAIQLLRVSAQTRADCYRALAAERDAVDVDAKIASLCAHRHVKSAIKDPRLFYNTIDKAVAMMNQSGVPVTCKRENRSRGTTIRITVPRCSTWNVAVPTDEARPSRT